MRKVFYGLIFGFFGAVLLFVSGCSSSIYEDPDNWAIIDNDTPAFFSQYDLIFLYPSQEEESESGYMNWVSGNIGDEVRRYVRLVISAQFGPRVRVFSPYVPLLSFNDYMEILDEYKRERSNNFDFYKTKLKLPIDYMTEALEVYFSNHNPDGHPFVIFGHGQGALVLYEAMKRCSKVHPKNGFVVGYFFGLPGVTKDEIHEAFGSRDITPARKRDGVGVIAVCNTNPEGEPLERSLALAGGEVINPLNWHTDDTPAPKEQNPGSLFFNHKEANPRLKVKVESNFCGATVDPKLGIVTLTGIPKDTPYKVDEWHFASDVWGVFAKSLSQNALERVNMYRFVSRGVHLPE